MPPSRTIATPVAAPCTLVESKGDGRVVVYYGRGASGGVAALYGPCDVLRMGHDQFPAGPQLRSAETVDHTELVFTPKSGPVGVLVLWDDHTCERRIIP